MLMSRPSCLCYLIQQCLSLFVCVMLCVCCGASFAIVVGERRHGGVLCVYEVYVVLRAYESDHGDVSVGSTLKRMNAFSILCLCMNRNCENPWIIDLRVL